MLARFKITPGDLFGGLTAGVVALPLCLAFGVASGLGAAAGLYGGIVLGIMASVFGGTAVQISGPTAPMTLIAAGVVVSNTMPDGSISLPYVFAVFLLAGLIQILFGVLRLGQYIRFMPYPVISGLMTGIGIIIITQQIFPALGLISPSSNPLVILSSLGYLSDGINVGSLFLTVATVVMIYVLPRFIKLVPPSLVALVFLTVVALLFHMTAPTIGDIPSGLPSIVFPQFSIGSLAIVLVAAIQLAFLGTIDSLSTSLVADNITKTHHNSNQELIGQGLGNMCAALVGGLPGAGAFMRTAINVRAGGRNHSSGVIHGVFLLLVLLGLSSVVRYIPHAVLAGILIGAGISIIDYRSLRHITKAPMADVLLMLVVTGLTIFADLITAVSVGMIFASFVFMGKIAHIAEEKSTLTLVSDEPWTDELALAPEVKDRLWIKHVAGPLFFGFVYAFRAAIANAVDAKILVMRMEQVSYIDQSGLYALQDVLMDLETMGVQVVVVGLSPDNISRLEAIQVIPNLLKPELIFTDFTGFQSSLPKMLLNA